MSDVDFKQVLKDSGVPVDEGTALARFRDIVTEEEAEPYNNQSPYSPFYRLVSVLFIKPFLWLALLLEVEILPALFLKTAKGIWVDLFAWQYGIERKQATKARGLITITRYDASSDFTIPAGTIIQSPVIAKKTYRLKALAPLNFSAGDTNLTVLCEAEEAGSAYNLSTGFYNLLSTDLAGIAKIENADGWLLVPGSDEETDDELKERCRNQFMAVNSWYIDAVYKSLVAEQAGISINDIYIEHDAPRGPGTANIYILFEGDEPAADFFTAITNKIVADRTHGLGDDVKVMAIPRQAHTATATIKLAEWLNTEEKENLKSRIHDFIGVAIRLLPTTVGYQPTRVFPFSLFSWSNLIRELHEQFSELVSIDFADDTDIETGLWIPEFTSLNVEVVA